MPIFQLSEELKFPSVELATKEGLIAVGGDLSPERLILAYQKGIFPWYSEPEPILWWSPDPRCIIYPNEVHISESMQKVLKKEVFSFTADTAFSEVIRACAEPRKTGPATWVTPAIIEAYTNLHKLGYAHSIEVWYKSELVGGLYGVALGSIFIGESMFHRMTNASKAAFICLCLTLSKNGFDLIDCQVYSDHLASLGAWEISRAHYLKILAGCLKKPNQKNSWKEFFLGAEKRLALLFSKNNVKTY